MARAGSLCSRPIKKVHIPKVVSGQFLYNLRKAS